MPTQDEKPNIYPPSIIDPLLDGKPSKPDPYAKPGPDPEGVAKDRYLGQLAADVAAQEAESSGPDAEPGAGSTAPPRGKPQGGGS
jgi:hypothetical protein